MMPRCALALATLLVPLAAAASPPFDGRLVDLTHPFDARTVFWPTAPSFALRQEARGRTDAGFFYAANSFCTAEHGGTHVDAPFHFNETGTTVDALPLERLVGPGVVVDVRAPVRRDRDHRVTVADLDGWERANGPVPSRAIVLLHTGHGAHWPDRHAYLGTAERGAEAAKVLHFPGLHPDAARWLVAERQVRAVGIDTASIDHGPSQRFEAHVAFGAAQVPVFENVAALDRLPPRGFTVIALPMKIAGGSGAPLRIVALLP
jgi:kynurenine formamidase